MLDIIIICISSMMVFLVRFGFEGYTQEIQDINVLGLTTLIACNLFFFFIFRTYMGILRFSTFTDLLRIVYALSGGYFVAFMILWLIMGIHVSNVIFFSIYILNMMLMVFLRIVVKEVYDLITGKSTPPVKVFVYGTRETGISLAKSLKGNADLNYKVMGFISDEEQMIGKDLIGAKVYAFNDNLLRVLSEKDVRTIIVSPQKMTDLRKTDQLNLLVDGGISLLTTSPLNEWTGKLTSRSELKDIQIEDLLPRETIKINMKNIADHIEGKRVMVTGAAGSIGSEIVRQVAAFNPYSITLVDQAETPLHDMCLEMRDNWRDVKMRAIVADISNQSRMEQIFQKRQPQYIFHAAAYKHVPMMEDNVSESVQTNIRGTRILADLAVKYKTEKFVMISTDKAVNPSNVMGCSKRICEIYVQALTRNLERKGVKSTQFITTRFGNVLGSNGSVIPLFRDQIKKGGPVTVTHPEIVRYFMTIPEACQLVLEAGSMGKGGEIFLFDMGKPVKILDLAKRMIRLTGSKNVKIEFSGLRHGEKLYEELLNVSENTVPTHHEKIMIANVREYDFYEVNTAIEELIQVSFDYNDMNTVQKMKQLVPEFQSKNSPYEKLDTPVVKEAEQ